MRSRASRRPHGVRPDRFGPAGRLLGVHRRSRRPQPRDLVRPRSRFDGRHRQPVAYRFVIDLHERVAIVTGAGRGIGRAYAHDSRRTARAWSSTTRASRPKAAATDEDPAADVVREITDAGGEAVAHRGDIGDAADGDALVELALDTWGRLDIVINNAGFGRPRMVFNLERRRMGRRRSASTCAARSSCRGPRASTGARRRSETGRTYGRLINTATGLLVYGGAGQSNYVAAKAGVQAFTEAVATEMAPYGVTANTIMPGANTRLAQIGWRMARQETDAEDRGRCSSTRAIPCTSRSSARTSRHPTRAGSRARRSRCAAGSSSTSRRGTSRKRCNVTTGVHGRRLREGDPAPLRCGRATGRSPAGRVEGKRNAERVRLFVVSRLLGVVLFDALFEFAAARNRGSRELRGAATRRTGRARSVR